MWGLRNLHAEPTKPTPPDLGAAATYRRVCSACLGDISHLPLLAAFCHRCGHKLPGANVPRVSARSTARGRPPPHPSEPRHDRPSSPIVLGYAKALWRLGRHYEFGNGVRAHPAEAVRCYAKAARLGDPSALAHLQEGGRPRPDSPALPAEP